ncbi:hypothetical protein ACSBR2_042533 [Camellia fascicularis]
MSSLPRFATSSTRLALVYFAPDSYLASQALLRALVERWWDTTNSFHFSSVGEMTITPFDFSMLIGLEVGVDPIPFDMDMGKWNTVSLYLLSALVTLPLVRFYDWGGAGLVTLYGYMSLTSGIRRERLGGYWRAWELWIYVYFSALTPEHADEIPSCSALLIAIRRPMTAPEPR